MMEQENLEINTLVVDPIIEKPSIQDEWSKIEDITDKYPEDSDKELSIKSKNISNYIKQDMEQYPDDKQLDDYLQSIPNEDKLEVLPSCLGIIEYQNIKLHDKRNELLEYELAIEQLQNDREAFISTIRDKAIEEYNREYLPKYRRELRAWYAKNKKQHVFNRHLEPGIKDDEYDKIVESNVKLNEEKSIPECRYIEVTDDWNSGVVFSTSPSASSIDMSYYDKYKDYIKVEPKVRLTIGNLVKKIVNIFNKK